jgi:hypothetical protein
MPKAKVNGVEVEFEGVRLAVLALACAAAASCGGEPPVEERVAGGALPAGEPPVVRACRAATSAFNPQEPIGSRTVPSASAEVVRLVYEAGPASPGLTAECAFRGDSVTWRLLSVTTAVGGVETPVQRAPETATYAIQGERVRLRSQRAGGTSTETTWTSTETPGFFMSTETGGATITTETSGSTTTTETRASINVNAPTGAE